MRTIHFRYPEAVRAITERLKAKVKYISGKCIDGELKQDVDRIFHSPRTWQQYHSIISWTYLTEAARGREIPLPPNQFRAYFISNMNPTTNPEIMKVRYWYTKLWENHATVPYRLVLRIGFSGTAWERQLP